MDKFTPQPMVGWFDVKQLANTGLKAVISTVFGSYADKRETIAAISQACHYDYTAHTDLWIDYISDLGDGFDSTYTMARMLAQGQLEVKYATEKLSFPKAQVVVLGGDEVYPVATKENYNNRLEGPYEAAWPRNKNESEDHMFAIPGNHDWYDGLSSFMKLFCQNRTIGNWRTRQSRSYFALKLTPNTWLWGIDIQLEADIDAPQLCYFDGIAAGMKPSDNLILCSAEPSWIYHTAHRVDTTYDNLRFFECRYIEPNGFNLILSLAGDLHHYARYSYCAPNGKELHKITSGGGGAFMHPTHNLPLTLDKLREEVPFELKKTFPSRSRSKKMLVKDLLFPVYNWGFGLFIASLYLLFAWALYAAGNFSPAAFILQTAKESWNQSAHRFLSLWSHSPVCILLVALFIFGFGKFCDANNTKARHIGLLGYAHGLLQVALMFFSIKIFSMLALLIHPSLGLALTLIAMALIYFAGGFLANVLMGLYLAAANLFFKIHDNEAYSAQKINGYKNFLRMHLTGTKLTIYPIGLKKVARWKRQGDTSFSTQDTLHPFLIEKPIVIPLK